MTTIIDELVVKLGIESKGFEKGKKSTTQGFNSLKKSSTIAEKSTNSLSKSIQRSQTDLATNSRKTARSMTSSGKDASGFFSKVRNEAIMMLGVFTAGAGLASFAKKTINTAASSGILAKQIGVNVTELKAMEAAAQRAGGASGAMSTQLANDAKKFSQVKAGGSIRDIYGDKFTQFGGDYRNMEDATTQLEEYAKIYERIKSKAIKSGGMSDKKATAFASQQIVEVGLSKELIPLISKGSAAMNRQIETQRKKISITKEDVAAALEAKKSWFDFNQQLDQTGQKIVLSLIPTLEKLTAWMSKIKLPPASEITETIEKWTDKIVPFFDRIEAGVDKVGDLTESIGGWSGVLKGLVALKLGGWALGLLKVTGALVSFSTAALAASAAAGSFIGNWVYTSGTAQQQQQWQDTLGRGVAEVGAYFGHEGSKDAITINNGGKVGGSGGLKGKIGNKKNTGGFDKGTLAAILRGGESGKAGYDAYNRGTGLSSIGHQDISKMTIGEIQKRQKLKRKNKKRLFAVGMYQAIPSTLNEGVSRLGLSKSTVFSPEIQERLFSEYLAGSKRPSLRDYIKGKSNNASKMGIASAAEWRSIADPRTGKTYADKGSVGNRASISSGSWLKSVNKSRQAYKENIASGMSDSAAYQKALHGETGGKPKTYPSFKTLAGRGRKDINGQVIQPKLLNGLEGGKGGNSQNNNIVINVKSTDPKLAAEEIKTTLNERLTSNFLSGMK